MRRFSNSLSRVDIMVYYYAVVDVNHIVTDVVEEVDPVDETGWIEIDSYNQDLVGMWYNIEDQTFSHVGNKYLIPLKSVDGAGSGLDADKLDGMEASAFALANHTHEGVSSEHDHDDQYASIDHTHSEYALADHTHEGVSGDYLPLTGGTVSGNLNVAGVVRVNGNQAIYDTSSYMIFGTNNKPTLIACKADSAITFNGLKLMVPMIVPLNTNTHELGQSGQRFKNCYLNNSPNVSSDRRLKQDIEEVDCDEMLDFIDNLNVVNFAFKDEPEVERIGLIAQDVEEVGGEKFIDIGDDGMYGLKTADLVYPLIASVQALYSRVIELEAMLKK